MAYYSYNPWTRRYELSRISFMEDGLKYQKYHRDVYHDVQWDGYTGPYKRQGILPPESYIYPTLYRNLLWNYYRYNPKRYAYWWWRGHEIY